MKVYLLSLMMALVSITESQAISYEEARSQARFLTDKMAYELNLNDAQYNNAYEINLDYLISIQRENDAISYLSYRNRDLRYILYDWQYTLFAAADYFFRPVRWYSNRWHYPIYSHYHISHFYYNSPRVYWHYKGGHGGRKYRRISYYEGRRPHWQNGFRGEHRGPVKEHRPNTRPNNRPNVPSSRPNTRPNNGPNVPSSRPNTRPNNGFHFEPATPNRRNEDRRRDENRPKDNGRERENKRNGDTRRRFENKQNPVNRGNREYRTPTTTPSRNKDRQSRLERRETTPTHMRVRIPSKENVNTYQRKSSTRSTVNSTKQHIESWIAIPS